MKALMISALGLFFLASCSWLPKISIIDDPLTREEHLKLAIAHERDGELDLAEREYRFALPSAVANFGLGNIFFQKGEPEEAKKYYSKALQSEFIPAAANNLAWLYLVEGGSLYEAKRLAEQAVEQAQKKGLGAQEIESYRATLNQIQAAIDAQNDPIRSAYPK